MSGGCWLRRGFAVTTAMLWALISCSGVKAQGADDLVALREKVSQLQSLGKYAEAVPVAEHYVALARERHGDNNVDFGTAIGLLASVYKTQGRYAEAEALYKRNLAIREAALGREHLDVAAALDHLANLYE